jgi:hypothetical protein
MPGTPKNKRTVGRGQSSRLLVFVTETGPETTSGPIVFVEDRPEAALPPNPRGLGWRYFATVGRGDALIGEEREAIEAGIAEDGYYISNRLISTHPTLHPVG